MKKILVGSVIACCAVLAMATNNTASAGNITVANPSFEILPAGGLPYGGCGVGCSYSVDDAIPGWTGTGSFGQFQPGSSSGNFAYFNYVPDGLTVAYSNGGTISQTVGVVAVAGDTYTLNVDVGFRHDVPDNSIVELVVGTHMVDATGGGQQFSGNWYDWTAHYTATAADAGAAISIVLISNGVQGNWDNVTLNYSVPEPGSLALLGAGLLGLAGFAARRRKTTTA